MKQLETIKFLSNKQQTAEHQKVGSKRGQKETTVKIYASPPPLRSFAVCFFVLQAGIHGQQKQTTQQKREVSN